jgi:ribosomal protein L15
VLRRRRLVRVAVKVLKERPQVVVEKERVLVTSFALVSKVAQCRSFSNVSTITALFPKGGDVSVEDLYKVGAARAGHPVKVLGNGDISVKVNVSAHSFSSSASEKIAAAGGSVKTL